MRFKPGWRLVYQAQAKRELPTHLQFAADEKRVTKTWDFEWEEVIELCVAIKHGEPGNELWSSAREKAIKILEYIGPSDY